MPDDVVRLSDLLGTPVRSPDGVVLGRIRDVEVAAEARRPHVTALLTGEDRVPWTDVVATSGAHIEVGHAGAAGGRAGRLLLRRDVLDAQVIDLAGRRLARVADIDLALGPGVARAVAVDVGVAAVLRRLGMRRLAGRLRDDPLDWDGLYLASGAGHRLQLDHLAADARRLSADELRTVIAQLTPQRGAEVLAVARPGEHPDPLATARAAGRPRNRFRIMRARRRAPS
jgi:sporulation protein YlmC with PRC-barrel domain